MRILIVKLSSLGDVIQTMAVVPDLLAVFPDAQIDWVVEEAFAPLVARVRGLRAVLPIAQRRWRKSYFSAATRAQRRSFYARLGQDAYDAVIDFQGLIKSAWVARAARLRPEVQAAPACAARPVLPVAGPAASPTPALRHRDLRAQAASGLAGSAGLSKRQGPQPLIFQPETRRTTQ